MKHALWLLTTLLVVGTAVAQDKIYKLEPQKIADIPAGRASLIDGKAGPNPHRFFVENVTIMTPIVVTLRAVNEGDDVRLKVTKFSWNEPEREGSTKSGQVSFNFRTEGEFQVSVDAPQPETPYKLLVWVGDEAEQQIEPVVVPKSQYKGDTASSFFAGGVVTWIIAVALIGILILLGILVFRRKRE